MKRAKHSEVSPRKLLQSLLVLTWMTVRAMVWASGIEYEHEKIDNLGKVDTRCTIVKKIEETSNGTKLYGYGDVPKSPVVKANDLLFTVSNKEFARRLYCGVVWTHDALIFAETYYQYRD